MKPRIIFATGNEGKMKEVRMILADLEAEVLSLEEAGINIEIVEDGDSFAANAIIKARGVMAAAEAAGCIILADDSGLEVDWLNKEPGIYSARYMGETTSYRLKNQNIIDRLEGVADEQRTARFVCAIAAVFPGGEVLTETGVMEGRIGYKEDGGNGFGYDPIFYLPEYACTSAQLPAELKNELSHRGKALRAMKAQLHRRLK